MADVFWSAVCVPIHFHLCSKLCSLHRPLMPANMPCEFAFLLSPANLPLDCAGISLCHSASVPIETLLMSHCPGVVQAILPAQSFLPVTCSHELQTCCSSGSCSHRYPCLWCSPWVGPACIHHDAALAHTHRRVLGAWGTIPSAAPLSAQLPPALPCPP